MIAVLDAVGSERPAIVGTNDGTLVAILLAAAHPERCGSLVLFAPTANTISREAVDQSIDDVVNLIMNAGEADSGLEWLAPSRAATMRSIGGCSSSSGTPSVEARWATTTGRR